MPNQAGREEEERLLLARIGRADTGALEMLYYRYRPRLHRFLLALGCAEADLDEICNETFFVVWRRSETFDGSCRLSTWILGIARNKALDLLRRDRRRSQLRVVTDTDQLPATRLDGTECVELHQWLEVALEGLPADQRAVVELAFLDGMSYQEIAALMECPESTVKTRMFHARRKLKQAFPEFAGLGERRNSQ